MKPIFLLPHRTKKLLKITLKKYIYILEENIGGGRPPPILAKGWLEPPIYGQPGGGQTTPKCIGGRVGSATPKGQP
jgi:hypothetical protein